MILLDDMCESKLLADVMGKGRSRFLTDASEAVRFVFDENAAAMVSTVAKRTPGSMLQALHLAILPYSKVWIEMPVSAAEQELDENVPSAPISRKGFLFVTDNTLRRGAVSLAWKFGSRYLGPPEERINMSVGMQLFDWSKPNSMHEISVEMHERGKERMKRVGLPTEKRITDFDRACIAAGEKMTAKWSQTRKEDAEHLSGTMSTTPNYYFRGLMEELQKRSEYDKAGFLKGIEAIRDTVGLDWMGEGLQVLASILLLNCHSSISTTSPDLSKINKQRVLRNRRPFFSHSVVHIKPSDKQISRTRGLSGPALRAHMVRGHFKCRKTGVFWWMPFLRGDSSLGYVEKEYEVQA